MGRIILYAHTHTRTYFPAHKTHQPIRLHLIFSLEILEKNNDECILISVIYWKKTGLLHTKINNHNLIYWKKTELLHTKINNHNIIYWKKTGLLHTEISNHKQWRPLIIIADNVINRLLLSKSVVPKHSV